jgi:hypothetical protein
VNGHMQYRLRVRGRSLAGRRDSAHSLVQHIERNIPRERCDLSLFGTVGNVSALAEQHDRTGTPQSGDVVDYSE